MPTIETKEVEIIVHKHSHGSHGAPPTRRPLTGHPRKRAAEATINVGAYNLRRDCLNQADKKMLEEGDFTGVPSLEVLRRAAAESEDRKC